MNEYPSLLAILRDWIIVNKPNWYIVERMEPCWGDIRLKWVSGWIIDINEKDVRIFLPNRDVTLHACDPHFFNDLSIIMEQAEQVWPPGPTLQFSETTVKRFADHILRLGW